MDTRNSKRSRNGAGTRAGELAGDNAGAPADVGAGAGTGGEGSAAGAVDAGAGSSSGLGSVAVEVDRERILEEAAALAASSSSSVSDAGTAPASVPALIDPQAKAADVAPAVRLLVAQCAAAFAPGWQITSDECNGVADAAALVLAYWIPDGAMDPKYLALITLATALYGVAAKRHLEDGSWRSLRAPTSSPPAAGGPLRVV